MNIVKDPFRPGDLPRGGIATIGNFDGVHLGHQEVLRRVAARAQERGLPSLVITFDPHPLKVLNPERAPLMIQTLRQRVEAIEECGIEHVVLIPFHKDFSQMTAEEFARSLLLRRLAIRELHVGERFLFGKGRTGDVSLLRQIGQEGGYTVEGVTDLSDGEEKISSTRVRNAVLSGDIAVANRLLGRPYAMEGVVAKGDRMGRKLGFPTMNLKPENQLYPKDGVYLGRVLIRSFERTFNCVTNVGTRPTVYENYGTTIESYVLDFSSDVYGEPVLLSFLHRLRDERVFPSMLELTAQIRRDVEKARLYFLTRPW